MAAAAVIKVDANTSSFSAKMNAAKEKVGGLAKAAGPALGPFAAMASSAGVIAAAGALAKKQWDAWLQTVTAAQVKVTQIARSTQEIATGVGTPQVGALLRGSVERAAAAGGASMDEISGGLAALSGTAPSLTTQQANRGAQAFQTYFSAGLSASSASQVMSLAGVMLDQGVDAETAFNAALWLHQNLGNQATEAVTMLPRLLSAGIPLNDALALALAGRKAGDLGATATIAKDFAASGGRGGVRALQAIANRSDRRIGASFGEQRDALSGVDFSNYANDQADQALRSNPDFAFDITLRNIKNKTEIAGNVFADGGKEQALQQALDDYALAAGGNTGADLISRFMIDQANARLVGPDNAQELAEGILGRSIRENAQFNTQSAFSFDQVEKLFNAYINSKQRFNTGAQE